MKVIEVKNLSYRYPGTEIKALKELSFSISRGEIFGFLGPSGAGKTTTQKILIGILKNYQGTARVLERDLSRANAQFYEEIGVAFENPNFYNRFTARENLNLFRSLYSGKTLDPRELMSRVNLLEDIDTRVEAFSKGMKVRLNFCRALLPDPQVIFLDEPTAGLDPANSARMKELILKLREQGKTIFLTTHDMGVAEEVCDKVAFIVDGRISLIDAPRRLKIEKGQKKLIVEFKNNGQLGKREFPLENLGNNSDFIKFLASRKIETMHTQEASLAQVFIEVTGRELI